jgi:hypothetical protein
VCWSLLRADEEIDRVVLLQRARRGGDQAQTGIQQRGRSQPARRGEHVAALDLLAVDAGDVHRRARAWRGQLNLGAVRL